MLLPTTEQLPQSDAIDALSPHVAAEAMLDGHQAALDAIRVALPALVAGARAMAAAIRAERSLIYIAAGSSGLMALADACELPGTFGIPAGRIQIHMAGGIPTDGAMPGNTEDDTQAAEIAVQNVHKGDAVIVLSASGSTPYAVAAALSAKAKGASIIAIANNPNTELLNLADIAICLQTPPEVVAGSTRLGAGSAQKVALNMMSSLMGIALGHVYEGQMVNVVADNAKLQKRATGMIKSITGVSDSVAEAALAQSDGEIKSAILVASGCPLDTATDLLAAHDGHLGPCINSLNQDVNV
ncbi:N-acetylmuramic acid 6-phosphate etherase [uncultured Roseobacter sp.]|uniref:N-acetylmuramic acid 6-phosphate etherase n=1 Tax=uncultured Roseobacter sp. TaxID=114847 RepID=UPI00262166FD|nr:N-acetylmuramic acid 6-phosphate etherase [uncultured Roseobacter sp.]